MCQCNVVDRYIEYHDLICLYKYFDVDMVNFHMDLFLKKKEFSLVEDS
jgi:hypothetical protein